ncbi:MAG: EAL domain-containing protein [Oleiphilaceae bacterium]|nr:EAL domain-containing protein [Oleiphilaceae bacterium]
MKERLARKMGFRGRLLIAMLVIVMLTVISIAGLSLISLFDSEKSRAREQLSVADGVAREVVQRRTELLASQLSVAVEDFGFRSAVATDDPSTMTSALANQSGRVDADFALLTDDDNNLMANLQGLDNGNLAPFHSLIDQARSQGIAASIQAWEGRAYKLIVVPIKAAGLKAWLTAGFLLDDSFATAISNLTATDVLLKRRDRGQERVLASSLATDSLGPEFWEAFPETNSGRMIETSRYFSRVLDIEADSENPVYMILFSSRAKALANYNELALKLGLLMMVVLLIAAGLVLLMARAFGGPVLQLANFASAIGKKRDVAVPDIAMEGELGTLRDALTDMLSRIREREQQLEYNAGHDELTDLPNRKAMDAVIRQRLDAYQPTHVLVFALADFKAINDTLGFAFGEKVLVATGQRLKGQLPTNAPFGRTGDNEFMALAPGQSRAALDSLIAHLRAQIEDVTIIGDIPITLRADIAVLKIPDQAGTPDEVRRRLNLTLEQAPEAEHCIAFYEPGGDENHLRELRLIRDLQPAMASGELFMHYQPKIQLASAQLYQVESLLRWQHPDLGFINPEEFILLAERSGQIHQLTEFILRQVASDSSTWAQEGLTMGVAVNLSALDLTNRRLPDLITAIFSDWQSNRHQITFEVTESAVMSDPTLARQTLEKLRDLGFKLSVDDFGTGYSSLAQLRSLPVHELKIDKSFILNLDTRPQDQLIVQSTIDMAHGLGLSVVAEGVENLGSWQLLRGWGCELAQGFFMARPMASDRLADWHRAFGERSGELVENSTVQNSETLQ